MLSGQWRDVHVEVVLRSALALISAVLIAYAVSCHSSGVRAYGVLTGTAYRLVDQTIVSGVVTHETEVPVTNGRIAIPELGIDQPLESDGSFSLRALPVNPNPDRGPIVTVIFTAPGLGSFTYRHLHLYPGPSGAILTPQMIGSPRVDELDQPRGTGPG